MSETEFRLKFSGAEARKSRISAKDGTETLAGFSAALTKIAHYASTPEVRFREPYSDDISFYISHTEPGSLDFVYLGIKKGAQDGAAAISDVTKLLKEVFRVATGQGKSDGLELSNASSPPGDIEVLAEAVEPSLKRAHRWINSGQKTLQFSTRSELEVEFNEKTKAYLEYEQLDDHKTVQDVSVGALNVNSKNGRVYFHDLGRTVPFVVSKEAETRTIPVLSRYLSEYAEKTGATVNIQFKRIYYADGRVKKVIIYDCFPIEGKE